MAEFEGAEIGLRAKDDASPVIGGAAKRMEASFLGLGATAAKLTAGILSVTAALVAMRRGFEWVKRIEEAEQQITGLILQFQTLTNASGKVVTGAQAYTQAFSVAKNVLNDLRLTALDTNQTTDDVRQAWTTLFQSVKAGSGEVAQLTRTLSVLADIRGGNVAEFAQSLARVIETGQYMNRGGGIALAKALKLPAEVLPQWNEAGKLAEELNKRLAQSPELLAALSKTAKNTFGDVEDSISRVLENLVRGPVDALKPAADELVRVLQSEAVLGTVQEISRYLSVWVNYFVKVSESADKLPTVLNVIRLSVQGLTALSMALLTTWQNVLRLLVSAAEIMLSISAAAVKYSGPGATLLQLIPGAKEGFEGKVAAAKDFLKGLGGFDWNKTKKEIDALLTSWDQLFNPPKAANGEMAFGWGGELPGSRKTPGNVDTTAIKKWEEEIAKAREQYEKFKLTTEAEISYVGLSGIEAEMAKVNAEFDQAVAETVNWVMVLTGAGLIKSRDEIDKIFGALEKIRDLKLDKIIRENLPKPETFEETFDRLYRGAQTMADGVEAAWMGIAIQARSVGQSVADAMIGGFREVKMGFDEILFDGLTSGFAHLSDILKQMFQSLLRSWISVLTTMVQESIFKFAKIRQAASGTGSPLAGLPAVDEKGNPMPGPGGPSPFADLLKGPNLGILASTVIGGAFGNEMAAFAGSATSAILALTTTLGPTIIGLIAAAVTGIVVAITKLLQKNTQQWETLTGAQILPGPGQTARGSEAYQRYGEILGSLGDIMRAGGGRGTGLLAMLRGGAIPDEFLASTQIKFGTGSPEDTQKLWDQYLKNFMPKTLLSMAFGRTPQGTESFPGIGGNFQGIVNFVGGAGDTPLTRMLKGLGFTAEKLDWIAGQIDVRDADEFIEWLTRVVTVVKGFKDVAALMGRTTSETFADFAKADTASLASGFEETAASIKDLVGSLDLYAGDEQVKKAEEALKLAQDFQKQMEGALRDIFDLIAAIREQAAATVAEVRFALMSPGQQESELRIRAANAAGAIAEATNPALMKKAVAELQSAFSALFNVLTKRVQDFRDLIAAYASLREAITTGPGPDPSKNLFAWMSDGLAKINAALADLPALDPADQLAAGQRLYSQVQQRYEMEMAMLQQIRSLIASIRGMFEDTIFQNELSLQTPQGQAGTLSKRLAGLFAELQRATSPEEIERISGLIHQYGQQYLGLFAADDPRRGDAVAWINQVYRDTEAMATSMLGAMGEAIEKDIAGLGLLLAAAETTLSTTLGLVEDDLEQAITDYTTAMNAATLALEGFADDITTIWNALSPVLLGATDLFTGLSTALGGNGGADATGGVNREVDAFGYAVDDARQAVVDFAAALRSGTGEGGGENSRAPGGAGVTIYIDGGGSTEEVAAAAYNAVLQTLRSNAGASY